MRPLLTALALLPGPTLLLSAGAARTEQGARAPETSVCTLGRTARLQATTRTCMGCHDGTSARGVDYRPPHAPPSELSAMHLSHPVDVDYAAAQMRKPHLFHPAAQLPRSLALPGGKVTCVTCHDGASREPARVTASPGHLCTSCHDL